MSDPDPNAPKDLEHQVAAVSFVGKRRDHVTHRSNLRQKVASPTNHPRPLTPAGRIFAGDSCKYKDCCVWPIKAALSI